MKYLLILFITIIIFVLPAFSQENESISLVYQSSMIGIGSSSSYDSYLSPLEYRGSSLAIYHEHAKMTGLLNNSISAQHLFNIHYSWADNPSGTASNYSGFIDYTYGLHYKFTPINRLQFFAGTQANGLLGFIYNTRNGNNPATGKAHINLNLSGIAAYHFRIKSLPILLKYQLNVPFIGVMFSPEFGQSYYEIGLGNQDKLAHFSSLHNYLSIRNIVSAEIPINRFTFRLSYMNWIYETKVNNIETRLANHTFLLGLSKNFFSVPYKKKNQKNYRTVF